MIAWILRSVVLLIITRVARNLLSDRNDNPKKRRPTDAFRPVDSSQRG